MNQLELVGRRANLLQPMAGSAMLSRVADAPTDLFLAIAKTQANSYIAAFEQPKAPQEELSRLADTSDEAVLCTLIEARIDT